MLNYIHFIFLLFLTNVSLSQISLKGTSWVNYFHQPHTDTIEFVPSSFSDSIYSIFQDDYHYGWVFSNDSTMDITKEHYYKGTQIELKSTKKTYNYFKPPQTKIIIDYKNLASTTPIFSLHTWDHVKATYKQTDHTISISLGDEYKIFEILELNEKKLKVKPFE